MRNARVWLLLGLSWLLCQSVWAADDAGTLITRYLDAMGGEAALAKIQSRVVKANFSMPAMGISAKMEIYTQKPDKYLSFVDFVEMSPAYTGVNGDVAWDINPMTGPRVLTGAERAAAMRRTEVDPLLHWKQKYVKADVAGDEEVNGKPCTKLVLTDSDGTATTLFLDKETSLLTRAEQSIAGQSVQTDFGDYRKVGDVMAAHKMDVSMAQFGFEINVDSIEDNVTIPAEKFDLPPEIKSLVE